MIILYCKNIVQGDINVISCDWENGSKGDYNQAMANSRIVAAEISRYCIFYN